MSRQDCLCGRPAAEHLAPALALIHEEPTITCSDALLAEGVVPIHDELPLGQQRDAASVARRAITAAVWAEARRVRHEPHAWPYHEPLERNPDGDIWPDELDRLRRQVHARRTIGLASWQPFGHSRAH